MKTINEALQLAEWHAEAAHDFVTHLHDMSFNGNHVKTQHLLGELSAEPTKHAFFQLMDRLGIRSGASFMWEHGRWFPDESGEFLSQFFQSDDYTANTRGPKKVLARMHDGGFRAFLSDQYRIYDNHHLLKVATEFVGDIPHEIKGVNLNADKLYIKIMLALKSGHDGDYGIGFSLANMEIGGSAVHIMPFLYRQVCSNGLVVVQKRDAKEDGILTRIPHRWKTTKQIDYAVHEALAYTLERSDQLVDAMAQSARMELPGAADILSKIVRGQGLGRKLVDHVVNTAVLGMEGRETAAGVINGLSYAAHAAKGLNEDQAAQFEALAGSALDASIGAASERQLAKEFFGLIGEKLVFNDTDA